MFLRSTNRRKDGKDHRYFSIVENRRLTCGKTAQRIVLYLGEINDQQQAGWRKTLDVFDEDKQSLVVMSLFPDDREVPSDVVDSIQVKLSGLELRRPRVYGSCWLACELWHQLALDEFWLQRLPEGREAISWEKVLRLLVINRLLDPGSEFRLHRHWYVESAMDQLLTTDFAVAEKDRLYRCLKCATQCKSNYMSTTGSSTCWPKVEAVEPKRWPFGESAWRACCTSYASRRDRDAPLLLKSVLKLFILKFLQNGMTKYEVLMIFARHGDFLKSDQVLDRLGVRPERRSVYSYLLRLCRQGLLQRGHHVTTKRLGYRITDRGRARLEYLGRRFG